MKIKDILNLDYNDVQRMTAEELKEATREAVRYANRRISTLQTHSTFTQEALKNFHGISEFSAEGNERQLRETLTAARDFLSKKTSTVSGAKAVAAAAAKRIGIDPAIYMSDGFDRSAFWKRYAEFMEANESKLYASRDVQRALRNASRKRGAPPIDEITDKQIKDEIEKIEWGRLFSEYDQW